MQSAREPQGPAARWRPARGDHRHARHDPRPSPDTPSPDTSRQQRQKNSPPSAAPSKSQPSTTRPTTRSNSPQSYALTSSSKTNPDEAAATAPLLAAPPAPAAADTCPVQNWRKKDLRRALEDVVGPAPTAWGCGIWLARAKCDPLESARIRPIQDVTGAKLARGSMTAGAVIRPSPQRQ